MRKIWKALYHSDMFSSLEKKNIWAGSALQAVIYGAIKSEISYCSPV